MDIQEAIQHCRDVAAGYTEQGKCPECAEDHAQLADWLEELMSYRATRLKPEEIMESIGFMSPVCVQCDGKTHEGVRTEKCGYSRGDMTKCIEQSIHLSELAKAEMDGMCMIMPFAPGTTFLQDETGEADIIFTGNVLFEVKSNEEAEFWNREEVVEELGPMKRR